MDRKRLVKFGIIANAGLLALTGWSLHKTTSIIIRPNAIKQQAITAKGTVDLLRGQQWRYLAGARQTERGLEATNWGIGLHHTNGAYAEDNPPVNLYGTRLETGRNFTVTARMAELKGTGRITLYGKTPTVLDEARYDGSSLHLELTGNTLQAGVKSGSNNYVERKTFTFSPQAANNITISRSPGSISLDINGRKIATLPEHKIFDTGQVWFGIDTTDHMLISELSASASSGLRVIDTSTITINNRNPNGFQQLAGRKRPGFKIGTAVSPEPLVSNTSYTSLVGGGWFGVITTENALKAGTSHPQENIYNFTAADAIVDFAGRHGLDIHGHPLVFGEANPTWMQQKAATHPRQMEAVMTDHITTLVNHYKGKIATWDVVNEPLNDDNNLRNHIWLRSMGESYINKAFAAAHKADPQAKLFINEYGLEGSIGDPDTERWDAFLQLIDRQLQQGTPIHGVGLQAHVDETSDMINPAVLRTRLRQLAGRGLIARISEMDVTNDNPAAQAQQFSDVLRVCLEEQNCIAFSTWGVGEGNGASAWIENGQLQTNATLPFNAQMQPRPPVPAMQKVLR